MSEKARERWDGVVRLSIRNLIGVLATVTAFGVLVLAVWSARGALVWMFVAILLAVALNGAVSFLERRTRLSRGVAIAAVVSSLAAVLTGVGFLLLPPLVGDFAKLEDELPALAERIEQDEGLLGSINARFGLVERGREYVDSEALRALSENALDITRGALHSLTLTISVVFMVVFLLIEGPEWMRRLYSLARPEDEPRWRAIGDDVYRAISGWVVGNLLISLCAGLASFVAFLVLGIPYPALLALAVALLDLVPILGVILATVLVGGIALVLETPGLALVAVAFLLAYQLLENHLLQPLIYGKTVRLSPLTIVISIVVGIELAGIVGALVAIPIAAAIYVFVRDWHAARVQERAGEGENGYGALPLHNAPCADEEAHARASSPSRNVRRGAEADSGDK
jgi:predicted PurR-regulated permease PerM